MDDKLKGDLAEAVVKYLFRAADLRGLFSIETFDGRVSLFSYLESCKNLNIDIGELDERLVKRNGIPIPDLAVVTNKRGLELIEVKYRGNGINPWFKDDVAKIWKEWQCQIILVSREKYPEFGNFAVIDNGDIMTARSVLTVEHWKISEAILKKCESIIEKIYSQT